MQQLFDEVNQMKQFMAKLRKGEIFGELATVTEDTV